MVTSAGGRGLARRLPSHLQGRNGKTLYNKFVEMNKEVDLRHPSANRRAKTLCKVREAGKRETLITIRTASSRS